MLLSTLSLSGELESSCLGERVYGDCMISISKFLLVKTTDNQFTSPPQPLI